MVDPFAGLRHPAAIFCRIVIFDKVLIQINLFSKLLLGSDTYAVLRAF